MKDSLPSLPANRDPEGLRTPPTPPAPGPAPSACPRTSSASSSTRLPTSAMFPSAAAAHHRELRTDSVLGSGFSPARMEVEPGDPAPYRTGPSGRSTAPRPLPPTNPAHARGLLGSSQPGSAGRSHPTESAGARGKDLWGTRLSKGFAPARRPDCSAPS